MIVSLRQVQSLDRCHKQSGVLFSCEAEPGALTCRAGITDLRPRQLTPHRPPSSRTSHRTPWVWPATCWLRHVPSGLGVCACELVRTRDHRRPGFLFAHICLSWCEKHFCHGKPLAEAGVSAPPGGPVPALPTTGSQRLSSAGLCRAFVPSFPSWWLLQCPGWAIAAGRVPGVQGARLL